MRKRAFLSRAAMLAATLLCCACASVPQNVSVDFPPLPPHTVPVAAAPGRNTGILFSTASYRPSFEDNRARMVGDTVTIQIVENVTASQKSSSTANRSSSLETGVTAFPFLPVSVLGKFTAGASTANDFSGKGGTESANTFSGSITTTVVEVLPNGHLIVSGEKQIGVAKNVDVLRFSGQVDPYSIQPGNTVASTQVANVRIEQMGRGAQQEAQGIGWLARFFLNISPF